MTLKKAIKEKFGSDLESQLVINAEGQIDFSSVKTQGAVRRALLEALRLGGYITLSLMVATAWKLPNK